MSAFERSGWRDQEISGRHRRWGFNCPAVDLDFLMVEYNLGLPVGMVEYKHHQASMPNTEHPTYRALRDLADGYKAGPLPFILAFYWPDVWSVRVHPMNDVSHDFYSQVPDYDGTSVQLTERRYVKSLYLMRKLKVDERVLKNCLDDLPEAEAA
jgi:hypothetical protein